MFEFIEDEIYISNSFTAFNSKQLKSLIHIYRCDIKTKYKLVRIEGLLRFKIIESTYQECINKLLPEEYSTDIKLSATWILLSDAEEKIKPYEIQYIKECRAEFNLEVNPIFV